jgi:hypothetical protein
MKKTFFIAFLLIMFFCDINVVLAQSDGFKKTWADMSVKEKRKAITGLEADIAVLQSAIKEQRLDSIKSQRAYCRLDSEVTANKAYFDAIQKKSTWSKNKKNFLQQKIESTNSELSKIALYDQYIIDYASDKLYYPWNSSVKSAVSALDSIKSPSLQRKSMQIKTLLQKYENLYIEIINVITGAQNDRLRTDTENTVKYKNKIDAMMHHTDYMSNYKGKIPFLDRLTDLFYRQLGLHSKGHIADFGILLQYDRIEKM